MPRRWPHLRWWIAALLFFSTVINYIDRQTLSVVAPVLSRELGLSDIEYSQILTAFLAAYTVMYIGSGFLVDRWGTRLSLGVFMVWWSLANMAHALVTGAFSLAAFRFLLGVGEPGNFMAAFKAVSEWYPSRERAFVNGIINSGAAVGAIVALPVITWITAHFGWRNAFVFTGAIGFLWLIVWIAVYHVPEKHPHITPEERTLIASDPPADLSASVTHWTELLRYRQTWGLLLARFFSDPVWWFYLFWLPKYLVDQRGFTLAEMGMLAWMPYLAADLGSLSGGWISGRLVRGGMLPVKARLACMLPCAMLMPLSFAVNNAPTRAATLALICILLFAHNVWKTNQMTLTNDIFPQPLVGTVSGILAFGNGIGGTLFTGMAGYIVHWFGYQAIFAIMGVLHPIAYLIAQRLLRGPAPKGATLAVARPRS